ncbi:hypothetical protein AUC68_07350 [Methyloceanibacter methanicus]|uniref:Uncharacterized protein n=1 Tax=Methyloceanibacter methanicus TaxID=1774968 RepID=A0A1E3VZI2_9HYPH|nr:hypothetical protein [Methyloceanibacter methanicus]ODR98967.1 hypothetical protein AUC68_07350 [Methyloceanibacter methanicus]
MTETSVEAHKDHLRYEQEHLKWSADHMRALAILKRVEAHLFAHEAEIAAHRAEIARHEESIAHGDAHAPSPSKGEHETLGRAHTEAGKSHDRLLSAIAGLEEFL